MNDMKFPTMEEFAKDVAEKALDEYEYKGRTLRQWIEIISDSEIYANSDAISRRKLQDKFEKWQKTEDYSNGEWNLLVDVLSVITSMPPVPQLGTNLASLGTDCISRQAAIDAFNTNIDELVVAGKENADAVERYLNRVIDEIKQLSPIQSKLLQPWEVLAAQAVLSQPAEPKRGKWNRPDMDTFNCNQCGATFVLNQGSEKMHFCPNCGADMRQREE